MWMTSTTLDPTAAAPCADEAFSRTDRLLLAVLLGGVFMGSMDVAIVNVAAPRLAAGLDVSGAGLQLVISAYTIAYAALLVTGSRLGHAYGYRRLFLLGLAGFTVASALCGLAPSGAALVAARAVQGAAAAAMTPQVMTMIQLTFGGRARVRALAIWATVLAGAATAGQVVGGALVSLDLGGLSWRPVFLVNIPIGVVLLVVGRRTLPQMGGGRPVRLDLGGVLGVSATVAAFVVPLSFGREVHWAWWTWLLLAAVVPLAVVTWRHLVDLRDRGGAPLFDPALLRVPSLGAGLAAVSAVMAAYGACLFAMTLHLQTDVGTSPIGSGLRFVPYALGFGVASVVVPRLPARWSRRTIVGGLIGCAIGYGAVGLVVNGGWRDGAVLPLMVVAGAGFGAGYGPVIGAAIARVPAEQAQSASGLLNTVIQLSFAIGVATLGSLYLAGADGGAASGHALAITFIGCAALASTAAALAARSTRP
jgi:MFS family permease